MRTEKLPSSYKYYVKRYFAKIHPTTDASPAPDGAGDPAPGASPNPGPSRTSQNPSAPEDRKP